MTTDEDKAKLTKLLQGIEVPETRLPERCTDLVREFHKKFYKEVEEAERQTEIEHEVYENPYTPDRKLLEENERKLRDLLNKTKRVKKEASENIIPNVADPKRPWRTNSNKEKLHRIDTELQKHFERSTRLIVPLAENDMNDLVKECQAESSMAPPVGRERLIDTVEAAKNNLPNFQYRNVSNSTATAIMSAAHDIKVSQENETASLNSSS